MVAFLPLLSIIGIILLNRFVDYDRRLISLFVVSCSVGQSANWNKLLTARLKGIY